MLVGAGSNVGVDTSMKPAMGGGVSQQTPRELLQGCKYQLMVPRFGTGRLPLIWGMPDPRCTLSWRSCKWKRDEALEGARSWLAAHWGWGLSEMHVACAA